VDHRRKLLACSKEEGLYLEMDFRAEQFCEMLSWRDYRHDDRIRLIRMEDATSRPYEVLLDLFGHLGLVDLEEFSPSRRLAYIASKACRRLEHLAGHRVRLPITPAKLPAERLLGVIWEHGFERLAGGRAKGAEDVNHHYRKGRSGDWRNHFHAGHVEYFKSCYNELLLLYGFEKDSHWSLGPVYRSESLGEFAAR
jgi:hypothetical protein